jgi:multimeric flavodoxin WrbA
VDILGIAASPRRHGNSETLLDAALKGAEAEGASIKKIVLSTMRISPCRGTGECTAKGDCILRDDMVYVLKSIKASDGVIVASPVYFGSVSAQLKAMIDRCQSQWVKKYKLKNSCTKNIKGAFICVSNMPNKQFFNNSSEIVNIFFKMFDIRNTQSVYFTGLENASEAKGSLALLKKAEGMGRKIAKNEYA